MSFPTTPLLDNFQRANGAMGANWNDYSGDPLSILSQQAYNPGGISPRSGCSWAPTNFGTDHEAWIHLATKVSSYEQGVMLRWDQGAGNGYFIAYLGSNNLIYRVNNNVFTQLGSAFQLPNFASGAAYWGGSVEASGSTVIVTALFWKAEPFGVLAARIVDYSPPAYNAANAKIGMYLDKNATTSRIDQFGGGVMTKTTSKSGRGRVAEFDPHLVGSKAWF